MRLTITTLQGDFCSIEVSADMELENVKALISVEMPGVGAQFDLMWNNTPLKDLKKTLQGYGIKENEMLLATEATPQRSQPTPSRSAAASTTPADGSVFSNIDFSAIRVPGPSRSPVRPSAQTESAESIRQVLLRSREQLAILRYQNPRLAEAVNDPAKFKEVLNEQKRSAEETLELNMADPFDVEAQQKIAERIRQSNIDTSMETAMEYMPESFGQVVMLYISCEVNGHPVKGFVDSGAQMTIMSAACARRCNIERLIDHRWAGIARGVGTQKIVGRVHLGQLKIAGTFLQTSFTILEEQEMDLLLGLDMLRRHQCVIDLGRNCLVIGSNNTSTPFLPEAELPAFARLSAEEGPSGGARAGAGPGPAEEKVKALVDQGFSREEAQMELVACNGDLDSALASLLSRRDVQ